MPTPVIIAAFNLAALIETRRGEMENYLILRGLLLFLVCGTFGVLLLAQVDYVFLWPILILAAYLALGMAGKYVMTKRFLRRKKAELLSIMDIHTSNPSQARAEAKAWVETRMKNLH